MEHVIVCSSRRRMWRRVRRGARHGDVTAASRRTRTTSRTHRPRPAGPRRAAHTCVHLRAPEQAAAPTATPRQQSTDMWLPHTRGPPPACSVRTNHNSHCRDTVATIERCCLLTTVDSKYLLIVSLEYSPQSYQ